MTSAFESLLSSSWSPDSVQVRRCKRYIYNHHRLRCRGVLTDADWARWLTNYDIIAYCDHTVCSFVPSLHHDVPQSPGAAGLKVTWRLHLLESATVWEADCHVLEATVGQFLEWEQSVAPLSTESNNPFEEFNR